jgi:hypothetical protein
MLCFDPDDVAKGVISRGVIARRVISRRVIARAVLVWSIPDIQLYEKSKKRKEQLEFLKILWGLLDTIIELLQFVRVYIPLILDTVSGFSEFPNSMRPPCTTMPWTIWPALVVLWGVCWMFVTPPIAAGELQLQLSLQDAESTPFLSSGM